MFKIITSVSNINVERKDLQIVRDELKKAICYESLTFYYKDEMIKGTYKVTDNPLYEEKSNTEEDTNLGTPIPGLFLNSNNVWETYLDLLSVYFTKGYNGTSQDYDGNYTFSLKKAANDQVELKIITNKAPNEELCNYILRESTFIEALVQHFLDYMKLKRQYNKKYYDEKMNQFLKNVFPYLGVYKIKIKL